MSETPINGSFPNYESPARDAVAITPSDTVAIAAGVTRAIYVGTGGDITALMASGNVALFTAVPQGSILPVRVSRVNATATTASGLVAMY